MIVPVLVLLSSATNAEVYHSRESALQMAFPEADSLSSKSLLLDDTQAIAIEELARTPLSSRLVNVHIGMRDGVVTGYAFIETHNVRSLPETLMVVIGCDGRNRGVHLLAFHEPKEYLPSRRWLGQFVDRELDSQLALNRGVAGVAGSTFTARAITAAVRRLMATHQVVIESVGP
jgi:hypothetical protein